MALLLTATMWDVSAHRTVAIALEGFLVPKDDSSSNRGPPPPPIALISNFAISGWFPELYWGLGVWGLYWELHWLGVVPH
jgi:hypothetical protein